MKSTVLFFVWHLTVNLATPNGPQTVNIYTTEGVNADRVTQVFPIGYGKGPRYEAGYCQGILDRMLGYTDDGPKGWDMILTDGTYEGMRPRTYTLVISSAATQNSVTVAPYGFLGREWFGPSMPFKVYDDPYDVPGAPKRPMPSIYPEN